MHALSPSLISHNVTCQCQKSMSPRCMIAGVNVADVDPYGKGGLAKVLAGGVNHNNVTIRFTSKPGEAMLFHVVVTGYCLRNYSPNQPYGWAEPLHSYSSYQYNATTNSTGSTSRNHSATHFANYNHPNAVSAAPPNKPWWQFW